MGPPQAEAHARASSDAMPLFKRPRLAGKRLIVAAWERPAQTDERDRLNADNRPSGDFAC